MQSIIRQREEHDLRKNKIILLMISILLIISIAGCDGENNGDLTTQNPGPSPTASGENTEEANTAVIIGLSGPSAMGMVRLFTEINSLSDKLDVEFDIAGSADAVVKDIKEGNIDVASLPVSAAAKLYNDTEGGIRLLAVNTLGMVNLVANDELGIQSINDLKGLTVVVSGVDSMPQFVFEYILKQNGLEPGRDLTVEYQENHKETVRMIESGEIQAAVLPQPFATEAMFKNENMKSVLELSSEWEKLSPKTPQIPMECLVATTNFIEKYTSELMQLLTFYNESVNWVNEDRQGAAKLIVDFGILDDEKTAAEAIEPSNIRFIPADAAKDMVDGILKALYEYNPDTIGGEVPGDEFYFMGSQGR